MIAIKYHEPNQSQYERPILTVFFYMLIGNVGQVTTNSDTTSRIICECKHRNEQ
jgi:hypothetical protein